MSKKTLYMHLMDDTPAQWDVTNLVFAGREVTKLASSLKQIRAEQKLDAEWGAKQPKPLTVRYGYLRIRL